MRVTAYHDAPSPKGAYSSANELLETIGLEPDQFEDCYQSRVVQDRIRRLGEVYSQVDAAAKSGSTETVELERKLQADCEELYHQRAKIVDGNGKMLQHPSPSERVDRAWLGHPLKENGESWSPGCIHSHYSQPSLTCHTVLSNV